MFERLQLPERLRHPLLWMTLAALGLRLFRIDFRSIWLDEAYSLTLAAADWRGILQGAGMDIHPPLFHLLLGGWSRMFGTSEFALRALSAVFGAALVPAAYRLALQWGGRRTAWWAGALVAVSPYFIELSRSGRMASLLALCSALSVYYFWKVLQKPEFGSSFGYCLAMLAAMYTHYFAFLVYASQHIYVFMGIGKLRLSREVRKNWMLLQMFLLIGFAPWLPMFWDHLSKGGPSWRGLGAAWWEPVHAVYGFLAGTACWTIWHKLFFLAGLGTAAVLAIVEIAPRFQQYFSLVKPRVWGLGLTLVFVPLGMVWAYSLGKLNVFDNRYLSMSALAVLILGAVVIAGMPAIRRRWVGLAILAAFTVPVINQYFVYGYYDNWRAAARLLRSDENIPVAVYPPWNATPLDYYLKGSRVLQGIPGNYDPITGRTSNFFHIDPERIDQLESMFSGKERLWLVLVNQGREQQLIRAWFEKDYALTAENDLQGIRIMRFERKPAK